MRLRVVTGRSELPALHLGAVGAPPRRGAAGPALAEAPADDLFERKAKVFGKQRVDQRVDRRVAISEPEEHGEQQGVEAVLAEGAHQVDREERQPAEDEASDDDAQGFGGFGFHAEAFHLGFDVAFAHATGGYLWFVGAVFAAAWTGAGCALDAAVATAESRKLLLFVQVNMVAWLGDK